MKSESSNRYAIIRVKLKPSFNKSIPQGPGNANMDCKQDQGQIGIGAIDLKAADKQIRAIMRQITANNASVGLNIHRMMLNDNEIQKLDTKLSLIEGHRRPLAKTRLRDDPRTFQSHSPRLIRAEIAALQLEIERNMQLLAAREQRILLNEARIRQCEHNLEKLALLGILLLYVSLEIV
jgi:hypothetical protein